MVSPEPLPRSSVTLRPSRRKVPSVAGMVNCACSPSYFQSSTKRIASASCAPRPPGASTDAAPARKWRRAIMDRLAPVQVELHRKAFSYALQLVSSRDALDRGCMNFRSTSLVVLAGAMSLLLATAAAAEDNLKLAIG